MTMYTVDHATPTIRAAINYRITTFNASTFTWPENALMMNCNA
jgi:hypothetical protein